MNSLKEDGAHVTTCSISIFGADKGGRSTGGFRSSSIRPGLKFSGAGDIQYGAMVGRLDGENIGIADDQICDIQLFNEEMSGRLLVPGAIFDIYEGARKIGAGRVQ